MQLAEFLHGLRQRNWTSPYHKANAEPWQVLLWPYLPLHWHADRVYSSKQGQYPEWRVHLVSTSSVPADKDTVSQECLTISRLFQTGWWRLTCLTSPECLYVSWLA